MRFAPICSLLTVLVLGACASKGKPPAPAPEPVATPQVKVTESFFSRTKAAVATFSPAAGGSVTGFVAFSGGGTTVDVHVVASGLVPGSIHGFHVHETGNCASPDFMSAGGHFNPTHMPHGAPDHPHHAGDMPSLLADPSGNVDTRFTLEGVTIGGAQGFVGHAVVLHATPDNYEAQPSGNSGARIACGVIAAQ